MNVTVAFEAINNSSPAVIYSWSISADSEGYHIDTYSYDADKPQLELFSAADDVIGQTEKELNVTVLVSHMVY